MADFYPPQFQNPDIFGSLLRGQQAGTAQTLAPYQVAGAQQGLQLGNQQLQTGQLNLDMLRQMMGLKQQMFGSYQQTMQNIGTQSGQQSTQTGADPGGPAGGIQNGPQGAVSAAPAQPSDPLAQFLDPRRVAANTAYGQFNAMLSGKDSNEPVTKALELESNAQGYQQKQRQLQVQGPMSLADTVAGSADADKIILNNPSLQQQWLKIAPQLGLNPYKDLTPANARMVARFGYNQLAGSAGLPPKEMPNQLQNVGLGQGEVGQIDPITGKKTGDLVDRQAPTFTLKPVWDPATNTTVEKPVQTGGYGMQGVGPTGNVVSAGGPVSKYPASAAALGFNTGLAPPKDPELKAAMFGSEMRAGMNTLDKMEAQGFSLSPKTRTLLINAATSEDEGAIKQFMSQEALAHMSPKDQTYIAALMPVLQAAGHDQSGARLTTSQVRQNIESLLPVDVKNKEAMDQVDANRKGFYNGLLTQAGSAAQLPQYKDTLGADLSKAQGKGQSAPPAALAYLQAHPETASHFKAKFGYLPNER